jgi:hypothetical protein
VISLLILFLLFGAGAWADEASDRAAIRDLIRSLNEPRDAPDVKPVASLFTSDANPREVARLSRLVQQLSDARLPWREQATPALTFRSMRFITPDVALVDAEYRQAGPFIPGGPLLFVMKREAANWRIASFRVLGIGGGPLVRPITASE